MNEAPKEFVFPRKKEAEERANLTQLPLLGSHGVGQQEAHSDFTGALCVIRSQSAKSRRRTTAATITGGPESVLRACV